MIRDVEVLPRAEQQVYSNSRWWAETHSVTQSVRWLSEFEGALAILSHSADRYPFAVEAHRIGLPVRQLNFGVGSRPTHRIVFSFNDSTVFVHGVYHASQRPLRRKDFDSPFE